MSRRPVRLAVALVAAALLSACDTGDGTTLREPVAPTTLPPPDTTPLETVPLEDPALDAPIVSDPIIGNPIVESDPPIDGGQTIPAAETDNSTTGFALFTPWAPNAPIDVVYTCDGADSSPALSWTGVPAGTQELGISLVDESNLSNGRPFIHWVLAGIAPDIDRIGDGEVPAGAIRGLNFFGDVGYTGPCPDPGSSGTFTITLFALNQQLELADGTPAAELLDVIATVSIDSTSSTGTVTR
ncbi:MAG: YbhB/YbcL family Raf kinase inhibitor-like protein [Ilumatobacter sp.]|uniref:YbhB/YbcL family Raf kinase inhibitor-like protein n=1 Tax=Ilumatobacter sp. TaxID=1967498 RepID=UPI003298DC2A